MSTPANGRGNGMTRRDALKLSGLALGGLAVGGAVVGTPGKAPAAQPCGP